MESTDRKKMKSSKNENLFNILFRDDIECYKCQNFGQLAQDCELKMDELETQDEICDIVLYAHKGK